MDTAILVGIMTALGTVVYFGCREAWRLRQQALNQLFGLVLGTGALVATLAFAALSIGIPLGALYLLVRFVKWAWIN